MFTLIQQQHDLMTLLDVMKRHDIYSVDTEFVRTKTRYPQLGLLQLNVNQHVYLIDPLHVKLDPFWQVLFSAKQLIFHSCNEDINVLLHYSKAKHLTQVFDTQIGLAFLGYGKNMGYQQSLEELFDITIYKYEARSNWLIRPLSPPQLDYASNDVVYLPKLAEHIKHQLIQKKLYDFVLADCTHVVDEIIYTPPLEQLYLSVARSSHNRRQLAQLRQLTQWREEQSIRLDLPPSFILKNKEMLDLVRFQPKDEYAISQLLDPDSRTRRFIPSLLAQLYRLPHKHQYPLHLPTAYRPSSVDVDQHIQHLIQKTAHELNIPADILIRKKWLNDLYNHITRSQDEQDLPDFLLSWRYDIITQPLLKLMYKDHRNTL